MALDAIPTGIKPLDGLIGGWKRGIITLLIGESGVGKSTLLIAAAANASLNGVRVNYIDTEGNPVEEVAPKVVVEHARDGMESLEESFSKLEQLPGNLLENSLIIVDSITYHYHALIRASSNEAERDRLQSRLETLVYKLHSIAVRHNAAAVVSTWPTSMRGEEEEDFVGGFAVKTYSRIQLRMSLTESSDVRLIEVIKHQSPRMYKRSALIRLDEILEAFKEVEVVE